MKTLGGNVGLDTRRQALSERRARRRKVIAARKRTCPGRAAHDAAYAGDAGVRIGAGGVRRVDGACRALAGAGATAGTGVRIGLSPEGRAGKVAVRAVAGDVGQLGIAGVRNAGELVEYGVGQVIDRLKIRLVGPALCNIDHQRVMRTDGTKRNRDEAALTHRVRQLEEGVVHRTVAKGDDEHGRRVVALAAHELRKRRRRHASAEGRDGENSEVVGAEDGDIRTCRRDVDRTGRDARGLDRGSKVLGNGTGRSRPGEVCGGAASD